MEFNSPSSNEEEEKEVEIDEVFYDALDFIPAATTQSLI